MAADLVLAVEARDDLDEAHGRYEAGRMGKGEGFLLRVEARIVRGRLQGLTA